jgi:hypothetical protein
MLIWHNTYRVAIQNAINRATGWRLAYILDKIACCCRRSEIYLFYSATSLLSFVQRAGLQSRGRINPHTPHIQWNRVCAVIINRTTCRPPIHYPLSPSTTGVRFYISNLALCFSCNFYWLQRGPSISRRIIWAQQQMTHFFCQASLTLLSRAGDFLACICVSLPLRRSHQFNAADRDKRYWKIQSISHSLYFMAGS